MKIFSTSFFEELILSSKESNRRRASINVHRSFEEPCQKLFNAVSIGSYIRPHRHALDPKAECLIAIKGLFSLITFSDSGAINDITLFGSEKFTEKLPIAVGLELPAGIWHTVVALNEDAILFETKAGPFDPKVAKEFASWAPEEGGNMAEEYFSNLRALSLHKLPKASSGIKSDFLTR
jgi:cupin fold WbuC family metalloprotein